MDGKNPKNNASQTNRHGLRLVKGHANPAAAESSSNGGNSTAAPKKRIKCSLVTQLNALADSVENDVKLLLNL